MTCNKSKQTIVAMAYTSKVFEDWIIGFEKCARPTKKESNL